MRYLPWSAAGVEWHQPKREVCVLHAEELDVCGANKPFLEPRKLYYETQMLDKELQDLVSARILVSFDVTAMSLFSPLYNNVYWRCYMLEIRNLFLFYKISVKRLWPFIMLRFLKMMETFKV